MIIAMNMSNNMVFHQSLSKSPNQLHSLSSLVTQDS